MCVKTKRAPTIAQSLTQELYYIKNQNTTNINHNLYYIFASSYIANKSIDVNN
ncbi:hypothetical protein DFR65_10339 [Oceanihabitans sediminis]|nr:hypothetical protein DFR65_10339 [Oceanihabitans sediminis]